MSSTSMLRLAQRRATLGCTNGAKQLRRGLATAPRGGKSGGMGKKLAAGGTLAAVGACAGAVAISQNDDAFRANLEEQVPFAKPLLDAAIGPRKPAGAVPSTPKKPTGDAPATRSGVPRLDDVIAERQLRTEAEPEHKEAEPMAAVKEAAHDAAEKLAEVKHMIEEKAHELLEGTHLADGALMESVKKAVEKGEEIAATAIEHGKEAFVRAETAAEDLLGDVKRAVSELVDQGEKKVEEMKEKAHEMKEKALETVEAESAAEEAREVESEAVTVIEEVPTELLVEAAPVAIILEMPVVAAVVEAAAEAVFQEIVESVADAAGDADAVEAAHTKAVEVAERVSETVQEMREEAAEVAEAAAQLEAVIAEKVREEVTEVLEALAKESEQSAEVAENVAEEIREKVEDRAEETEDALKKAREQVEEAAETFIEASRAAEEEAREAALSAEAELQHVVQHVIHEEPPTSLPRIDSPKPAVGDFTPDAVKVSAAVADPSRHTFDAEDLWKRFESQEVPEGMVEQLQAKVQFLVDEAARLTAAIRDTELAAEDTLALAVRDTEAAVKEQMGREIVEAKRKAHETIEAERRTAKQKLEEQVLSLAVQHNEDLLRQQRRLEDLHELYYRDMLAKQGEKQYEAGKLAYLLRLHQERAQRFAVLEGLVVKLKEIESMLDSRVRYASDLQKVNRLWVAKAALESAYRSGEPLGLSRHVLADGQADPLVKLAVDALPDAVFSKGTVSYGLLQERMRTLRPEARRAAYLPEDGGGILANIIASVMSRITFARAPSPKPALGPKPGAEGEENEAALAATPQETDQILARTEFWLAHGNLDKAAREVNQLRGLPRKTAQSWLDDARARLEMEQTLRLLDAYIALNSVAAAGSA